MGTFAAFVTMPTMVPGSILTTGAAVSATLIPGIAIPVTTALSNRFRRHILIFTNITPLWRYRQITAGAAKDISPASVSR
jgi:hypothetical protein